MNFRPHTVFAVLWSAWFVSWIAAALFSARAQKREPSSRAVVHRAAIVAGALLLTPSAARRLAAAPLWDVGRDGAYALAALTLAGLLFTWWARIHLGRLWSGSISRKQHHRVVDSGPYALVRHPIYTGLIFALFASAAAQATATALAGAALVACGLFVKARAEERFLAAELGADAYGAYRRRVPMLLPGLL